MLSDPDRARHFEALVHASPDFLALADVEGRVQFVSAAGRQLVGMPDDVDVSGTTIADYLTEEGLAASVEVEQPSILATGSWQGESTLRDWRGGPPIPVAVSSYLVTDLQTGRPLALATVQRDLRESRAAAAQVLSAQEALLEGERRQRALLLHMSDVIVAVDPDGTLRYASPSASRVLGYDEGSLIGRSVLDVIHPDDRARAASTLLGLASAEPTEVPARERFRLLDVDGSARHYEALATSLLHEPSVGGIVVVARDVEEQYRAELLQDMQSRVLELIATGAELPETLGALAEWVDAHFVGLRSSILLLDETSDVPRLRHLASPRMPAAYHDAVDGLPVADRASPCAVSVTASQPTIVADLLVGEQWAPYQGLARECGVRSCWSYPVMSPATGQVLGTFALYRAEPGLPDADLSGLIARASHLVGIAVDRAELVGRLAFQASHDGLTGLPNRAMLLEHLEDALSRRPLAGDAGPVVIFLDLDRLKIVNDSLGHERGDELLVRIAERLPRAVPADVLVARFGGDEFVILHEEPATREQAGALAEAVLEAIARPVRLEGRLITPAASAGVVLASAGQTATEVLRDADIAMYRAKHRGGNAYEFSDADMHKRAFDRLDLEGQIRHGLSAGEFRLVYQPIVDMRRDCAVVGFEALVRWQHPTRGLLAPASFIALAEETGLIVPLGRWVMTTAAAEVTRWSELLPDRPFSLSVNLAAKQLTDPGLVEQVREVVSMSGGWQLWLELTESALMDDSTPGRPVLDQLREAGASLSIDDFGTGFSSLSYLTQLPVSAFKLDRSFVHDLHRKTEAVHVAAAVIGLASTLDLHVVAEGVETEDQRDTLYAMGCRYAQGYLFARPLEPDAALAALKA
jgi:diguanylate cyclase (GGDEF)-like protein/PAS domain S-box-containing protein